MLPVDKLKLLLGIKDDTQDDVLEFVIDTVRDEILNYCNLTEIPTALGNVMVRMAADLYRSEGYGNATAPQAAKSVTRGDVTIQYGNGAATAEITGAKSVLDDYKGQLRAFRRLRW